MTELCWCTMCREARERAQRRRVLWWGVSPWGVLTVLAMAASAAVWAALAWWLAR